MCDVKIFLELIPPAFAIILVLLPIGGVLADRLCVEAKDRALLALSAKADEEERRKEDAQTLRTLKCIYSGASAFYGFVATVLSGMVSCVIVYLSKGAPVAVVVALGVTVAFFLAGWFWLLGRSLFQISTYFVVAKLTYGGALRVLEILTNLALAAIIVWASADAFRPCLP